MIDKSFIYGISERFLAIRAGTQAVLASTTFCYFTPIGFTYRIHHRISAGSIYLLAFLRHKDLYLHGLPLSGNSIHVLMKAYISLLCFFLLSSCSTREERNQSTTPEATKPQSTSPAPNQPIPAESKKSPPANAGKWTYEKKVQADGSTVSKATITASNILEFTFPYNGGSTATLTLRKRESGTTVYLEVSKGHFNRSFQNGTAKVRFDRQSPITYALVAAENGRANIVFFDDTQKLIRQIKAARTMTIDVGFAGQGTQQIRFSIAGLRWN